MDARKREMLMRLWREDLAYIQRDSAPPEHHFYPGYMPGEGRKFRGLSGILARVMIRLQMCGWTCREIGEPWGFSPNGVSSRVFRYRQRHKVRT